jgi:hypothetical protein
VKGRSVRSGGNVLTTLSCSASGIFVICCDLTRPTITRLARIFQSTRTRRRSEQYIPLVALCLRHFLADFIICMCVFDFRQAQHLGHRATVTKVADEPDRIVVHVVSPNDFSWTAGELERVGPLLHSARSSNDLVCFAAIPARSSASLDAKKPRSSGGLRAGLSLGYGLGSRELIIGTAAQGPYDGTARYPHNPQDRLHRKLESEQN